MKLQIIQKKIHEIRGQRVMLDFDLAQLYEVETRTLNQAVKRNIERFPERFMFQVTRQEWKVLKSQIVISKPEKRGGTQKLPYVFTEHGVTMLASVLRSKKAIQMNIAIVEAFIALKELALTYKELAEKIAKLERKYNHQFADVYEALDLLLNEKQTRVDWENRQRIGFKRK